jgi:hypothetical protein
MLWMCGRTHGRLLAVSVTYFPADMGTALFPCRDYTASDVMTDDELERMWQREVRINRRT